MTAVATLRENEKIKDNYPEIDPVKVRISLEYKWL